MLRVKQLELAYRWLGPVRGHGAESPVLVFLHEALGSIGQWKGFPLQLANVTGLPALVYERQGHGGSSPLSLPRPNDYLEQEACDILPGVLHEAGVDRAILVGHSDGATIALMAAASTIVSAKVAGVVAIAPHVFIEQQVIDGVRGSLTSPEAGQLQQRLVRYHRDISRVHTLWRAWTETWLRPGFQGCEIRRDLARITCPVFVVQGTGDVYGTLAQVDTIVDTVRGPVDKLILLDCGHQPHLERLSPVVDSTAAFLARSVGLRRTGSL